MSDPTARLWVDGVPETFTDLEFSTPTMAYEVRVPGERAVRRVLGDWGFSLLVIGPSPRLLAMHGDGRPHTVNLAAAAGGPGQWSELDPVEVLFTDVFDGDIDVGPVLFGHRRVGAGQRPLWRDVQRKVG